MGGAIPCMVCITWPQSANVTARAHIQQPTDIVLLNEHELLAPQQKSRITKR